MVVYLGDGYIQRQTKNNNGRYIISIKASNKDYILFLKDKVFYPFFSITRKIKSYSLS